jgi:glyoxylase-like metal-dependent hydrolase (beta-lactamase superfamily II)
LHIEIKQDLPGFDRFFGAWVVQGVKTFVIDVGPAASADRLIEGLEKAGIDRVDYVLLTHVHIDHAGALAPVLARYPEARAVFHEIGLRHLIDPEILWQGSLQVLGDLARAYGRPEGSPAERLVPHTRAKIEELAILETPGHAPHHLSYSLGGNLFSGEAGGNLFKPGGKNYLRPATPSRFFLHTALASVERLLELPDQPIFYAHYENECSSTEMLGRFRVQLGRWRDIIAYVAAKGGIEDVEERCIEALLLRDPELSAFARMDPDTRARERTFIANSVRGYLGFLGVGNYK